MTFVSYAQNFEDVLLWRALKDVSPGFYIDAGAWHPDMDSVTRAFYDRGWRGINVEPSAYGLQRMVAARPRDVNLGVALGAAAGEASFFALSGGLSGLSTLDRGAVDDYTARGWAVTESTVQVETLAAVCRAHAPRDIHFLKIDVEGHERAVLEGADFAAFRPWILVIEATVPMEQTTTADLWEDLVFAAGYGFAWFDGLNRYYIASERLAALGKHFVAPPNVFDDFVRAADTEWARRIEQAETRAADFERQLGVAERRGDSAADRSEAAHLRLAKLAAEAVVLQNHVALAQADAAGAAAREAAALRQLAVAEDWLGAMRQSTSWRLTRPLRQVMSAVARKPQPVPEPAASPAAPTSGVPKPIGSNPAVPTHGPLRAVHQFHSGSAPGDAITNAMLLTRGLLRGLGYDSRIFVEHRDPACGDGIHGIDELPAHDRYVLIVRHSMGHDALARILALTVRKVLIYHNITPPELLEGNPFLQRYAALGREQLAMLRPAVVAALADSDYNALELRRAGFDPVSVCQLLTDAPARLARAPGSGATRGGPVLTILFVGRLAPSKGQLALLAAYQQFRALYAGESRLVLVGRHGGGADRYTAAVLDFIRSHGLGEGAVVLAGHVSDAALDRWYSEADLYVSLSRHEGFGVPLVEAMAHGVPILALASGAVPYTLGAGAMLIEDDAPSAAAASMLDLARDPAWRRAMAEAQRESLHAFALPEQLKVLVAALVQAGAMQPADPHARDRLANAVRYTIAGHVNGSYSLAEVNRALALELQKQRQGRVRLLAIEGGPTSEVGQIPEGQRAAIRRLLARAPFLTGPEIVVSQHYPVWVPPEPADLKLALFFWEETLVPLATVAVLNAGFAGVVAPSWTVAKALIDSGVSVPVGVVAPQPRLDAFQHLVRQPRTAGAPFSFLHVSSCFPRKGVDILLAAWAKAFRRSDPVRLVIKGFPNPHNTVAEQLTALLAVDPDAGAIELVDRDLDEAAMLALYAQADAVVLPTRGEGFNIPAAEALAAGIPLIVTGWGGHMDMLDHAAGAAPRLLAYRMAPSQSHLATPFSLWAEPEEDDLVAALREAVATPGMREPWRAERDVAQRLAEFAADLLLTRPPPALSVGWVTTWDVPCGIAEYSRQLLAAVPGPATVFADLRVPAAGQPGDGLQVVPVWRPGDPATHAGLIAAILRADPRAVVLQHQPGLFGWAALAPLLQAEALWGRVVCITLHNTASLLDAPAPLRAELQQALARLSRVVVHTLADVNRLAGIGLAANVTLLPQGVPEPAPPVPVRALPHDAPVLIGCYGFFLPGKGIPELIGALLLLRRDWPNARLRLVNAEYPLPESAAEIAQCRAAVAASGLQEAVTLITAFADPGRSTALLRECDLVVLPYQRSNEASSAALRTVLAAGVAAAVTPLGIFEEAAGAVMAIPGPDPEAIAAGIAAALRDTAGREATVRGAAAWVSDRSWNEIGRRWHGMLQGLSASGVVVAGSERPGTP